EMVGPDIIPESEGVVNFQDPEKARRDVQEAVEKFRTARNRQMVVYIPPDFHHPQRNQELKNPDLYLPGTRIVNPELLRRPTQVEVVGPRQFTVLPLSERQLTNIPPEL